MIGLCGSRKIFLFLGLSLSTILLVSCIGPNAILVFSNEDSFPLADCNYVNYYDAGSGTSTNPYQICNSGQILELASSPSAWNSSFQLISDIDMQNSNFNQPIGTSAQSFSGTFDGQGHMIMNTTINTFIQNDVGFFGSVGNGSGGTIQNLTFNNLQISGNMTNMTGVGAIGINNGSISNVRVVNSKIQFSPAAISPGSVGALVGQNSGMIYQSSVDQSQILFLGASANNIGGLVGENEGSIQSSFAGTAVNINVPNGTNIGGLVGNMLSPGQISESFSGSSVIGTTRVGGLVGEMTNDTSITNAYSTGAVSVAISGTISATSIGGLVGDMTGTSMSVQNAYATGAVTVTNTGTGTLLSIGGLIGSSTGGAIAYAYFSGSIVASANTSSIGGLIGDMVGGSLSNSFSAASLIHDSAVGSADDVLGASGGSPTFIASGIGITYSSGLVCTPGCTNNNSFNSQAPGLYSTSASMVTFLAGGPYWSLTGTSYPTLSLPID